MRTRGLAPMGGLRKQSRRRKTRNIPSLNWRNRFSFTLIEVLVAISIIAVLASMLVPGMKSAKDSALQAACMNNMRQIGVAIQMYGDDRGVYPWGYEITTDWTYSMAPYFQKAAGLDYSTGSTSANLRSPIIMCPSRTLKSSNVVNTYGSHDKLLGNKDPGSTYKNAPTYPRAFPFIERPTDVFMFADADQDPGTLGGESRATLWNIQPDMDQAYSDATASALISNSGDNLDDPASLGQIRWRHKNNSCANFVMVDGHVESISQNNFRERHLKITGP